MESKKLEKPCENATFQALQGVMKPDEETGGVFPTMKPLDKNNGSKREEKTAVRTTETVSYTHLDRGPSKAADGFENLQYEIAGQPGARGACARKELPAFINKNGLFLGPVGFCAIPNEIKSHEHPHSQQITGKRGNVQYGVLIIQPYIGLLVKGAGRAIYQAIENMGHASGFRGSPQNLIQVTQHLSLIHI